MRYRVYQTSEVAFAKFDIGHLSLLFLAVAETVSGKDCEECQEAGDQQDNTNYERFVVENCLKSIEAV